MKKYTIPVELVLILFWVLLCPLPTSKAESTMASYTLGDCLQIGLERSLTLTNARRGERLAHETIREIRAQVYPSLDASAAYTHLGEVASFPGIEEPFGREDNYSATVEASQLLYSGGGVRAALRAAKSYKQFAAIDVERQQAVLVRDIKNIFYEAMYIRETIEVSKASVEQLSGFEKQTAEKYRNEAVSEFEWLSAQVKLANEKPKLIQARNNYELIKSALKDMIYLEAEEYTLDGELNYQPLKVNLDNLYARAESSRNELRQSKLTVQMREESIKASRSDYFPEIRAFANYQGNNPGQEEPAVDEWEWQWAAGLSASWNILDGGLRRSELNSAKLERDIAVTEDEDLRLNVRLEIKNAYLTLKHAEEVVLSTQESVGLAQKALDIAQVRYDEGLATHLEFSDSNLTLRNAQLIHYMALRSYQQARADLEYACGVIDLEKEFGETENE